MPTFWQKLQSLFYPVRIRKSSSPYNPVLELFYYRGRYSLAVTDAVYSDGGHYRPLVAAFTAPAMQPRLAAAREVLVLGTGLASAVHVLHRFGRYPHCTLVEIDRLVLDWAMEHLPAGYPGRVTPVYADAFAFIAADRGQYDVIVADIFFGRTVPAAVTQAPFLKACQARLATGGCLVLNYMVNEPGADANAKAALSAAFGTVTELSFGINKVYIATA